MIHDFHPEARFEYREAAIYYDTRRRGLGTAFTVEIEATIDRIKEAPERCPIIEQDMRKCLTHVFPYSILYTVEPDAVLIISVMHLRRKPGYWRNRLPEE